MSRDRSTEPASPARLKAVVTDVDGTITDRHRRLDLDAARALIGLEARGIPVVIATGNVLPIAFALHRFLGLSGPIVAENGGVLYTPGRSKRAVLRLANRRLALAALAAVRRAGVPAHQLFTDRWRESEVALEPTVSVRRLQRALGTRRVTVESTGFAIHLMEPGAGKRPTIEKALRRLGLSLSDCLVAGDGDNDVPMLEAAGWAVSFPEASPRARAAADYIARGSGGRGFVEALKRARFVSSPRRGSPRVAGRNMPSVRRAGKS